MASRPALREPRILDVLSRLASAIDEAAELPGIYDAALNALREGLGVERSSILLFDDGGVMRFVASRGLSDAYRHAVEGHSPWSPGQRDAVPIPVADVRDDPALAPLRPVLESERIRSLLFVPLLTRGAVIGKFMCYGDAPRTWPRESLSLARTVAQQVAFAVERTRAQDAMRRNEERLRFALDAANMGTWEWELAGNRVHWSDNLERVHGLPPGTFDRTFLSYEREIHPEDRPRVLQSIERAIRERAPHDVEYRIVAPDGTVRWVEGKGRVEYGPDLAPVRMAGVCMAIDRRKRAELERSALQSRAEFLAEASALLSSSLDYVTTLQNVAALAVPRISDWCAVYMRRDDGSIEELAAAHADPLRLARARALRERFPISARDPHGAAAVIRENRAALHPEITAAEIDAAVEDPEYRAWLLELGIRSAMLVPIRTSEGVAGALAFIATTESDRRFTDDDLGLAQDVAQRAGMAIENARLYHAAEAANRAKDQFLATLSHELRTPLNAILGWTRLLQQGRLAPDRTPQALGIILRNAELQARLISDILDVARIRTGKLRLDRKRLETADVVKQAAEALEPVAAARGVAISLQLASGLETTGDPERLQQVAWNLLSNAVKFTPDGGRVEVVLGRERAEAVLRVTDTGIGIPAEFLPHLFERFRQADGTTTRNHAGLGLGLAITRHLVELHGGRIEGCSAGEGRGATFTVRLPLASQPDEQAASHARRSGPIDLSGRCVLVVDDDVDSRLLIAELLERAGARVRAAASVAEAIERLQEEHSDLIVADIAMPGEDGYALLNRLVALPGRRRPIPAIAVTAHARDEDRARSLASGFLAHLSKPVEEMALLEVAASVLASGGGGELATH